MALTKILSRSRQSLNEEPKENKFSRSPKTQRSSSVGPKTPSFTLHVAPKTRQLSIPISSLNSGIIYLPKEYNPAYSLTYLENMHHFFSKTFHKGLKNVSIEAEPAAGPSQIKDDQTKESLQYDDMSKNSFTNLIFSENFEGKINRRLMKSNSIPVDNQFFYICRGRTRNVKNSNEIICNYSQIILSRKTKEMHILGCLIVELFLSKQLRTQNSVNGYGNFDNRLQSVLSTVQSCKADIPPCIKYVTGLLLPLEIQSNKNFQYPSVSEFGLPAPSAHFLLEPLLNCVVPFSKHFLNLYNMLSNTKDFVNTTEELNIFYYVDCNGLLCQEYENLERTKMLFVQNISECKVKLCAQHLEAFLKDINMTTDFEIVQILVPHVKQMIEDPSTSVLACWYLFDSIARVLGPKKTTDKFLQPILKLYENTIPYNRKIAKLYHHSFLLRLIVRFGLKTFLEYFITPLVETVGGYRIAESCDTLLHTHSEKVSRKASNLKLMVSEQQELSPSDESSSSERNLASYKDPGKDSADYDIFEYENEEPAAESSVPMQSLIEHLELNVSSDLPFNHSGAEEALDALDDEQMQNLGELELNVLDDDEGM